MKVSVVNNHNQKENLKTADVLQIFEAIKTGGKQKEKIEYLRTRVAEGATDAEQKAIKSKLSAICFNGLFKIRNKEGLVEGSGLMILDFDDVGDDFISEVIKNKYVYAGFRSPTATGYKVLIKIPIVKNDAEFKEYFYAVQKHFTLIDPLCKDVPRLCYFTWDENIFINENSEIFTEKVIQKPQSKSNKTIGVSSNQRKIMLAVDMISESMVGNRHGTALKAGRLIGGYIAGGEVDEYEALEIIIPHIQNNAPDDFKDHVRAFVDGIANGKKQPLSSHEIEEIVVEDKLGKIHSTLDESQEELDDIYENGYKDGYKLGWKELDELYTLRLGSTTYLYSAPGSGKTQFWFNCLVNLSIFYGMKHAIFSPETGTATEVFKELIQTYGRRDYTGEYKMNAVEKSIAEAFVKSYFIVIDPDKYEKDVTVFDICDYVTLLERKFNQQIHTITIDPWNEVKHDYENVRQDLKLENELKFVRRNAKNNNRHICLITHVRDQEPIRAKNEATGEDYTYFTLPTAREIAGGQTWYRKGMMMMAIWRPIMMNVKDKNEIFSVAGRSLTQNQTVIQVQKTKPKGVGRVGEMNLFYNFGEHTFIDGMGEYAKPPEKTEKVKKEFIEEKTPWD